MTDDIAHLMLEQLKRIRASQERTELEISDLKSRMTAIEIGMGNIHLTLANMSSRMDRFDERLGRIERRLELAEV